MACITGKIESIHHGNHHQLWDINVYFNNRNWYLWKKHTLLDNIYEWSYVSSYPENKFPLTYLHVIENEHVHLPTLITSPVDFLRLFEKQKNYRHEIFTMSKLFNYLNKNVNYSEKYFVICTAFVGIWDNPLFANVAKYLPTLWTKCNCSNCHAYFSIQIPWSPSRVTGRILHNRSQCLWLAYVMWVFHRTCGSDYISCLQDLKRMHRKNRLLWLGISKKGECSAMLCSFNLFSSPK